MRFFTTARILTGIFSFAFFILLLRVTSIDVYKSYIVFFSLASVVSISTSFGSDRVFYNFFPSFLKEGILEKIIQWSFSYFMLRITAGFAMSVFVSILIFNHIGFTFFETLFFICICLVGFVFSEMTYSILVSVGKHTLAALCSLLSVTSKIVISLLYDFNDKLFDLFYLLFFVLLVDLFFSFFIILLCLLSISNRISFKRVLAFDFHMFVDSLRLGLKNNLTSIYQLPFNASSIKAYSSFFISPAQYVTFVFVMTAIERLKLYSPQSLFQSLTESRINLNEKKFAILEIRRLDSVNSMFFRSVAVFGYVLSDFLVNFITSGKINNVSFIVILSVSLVYYTSKSNLFSVYANYTREHCFFERLIRINSFVFLPICLAALYFFDESIFLISLIAMTLFSISLMIKNFGFVFLSLRNEFFYVFVCALILLQHYRFFDLFSFVEFGVFFILLYLFFETFAFFKFRKGILNNEKV